MFSIACILYSLSSSFLARSGGSSQVAKLMSVFGEMCVDECKEGCQQVRDALKTSAQIHLVSRMLRVHVNVTQLFF